MLQLMLAVLLLVEIARCAPGTPCPSAEELKEAVRAHVDDEIGKRAAAHEQGKPDEIVLVHPRPISKIDNIFCGRERVSSPNSINCSFTINYVGDRKFTVATLAKRPEGWIILNEIGVYREGRLAR